jgi:hypothetical protein
MVIASNLIRVNFLLLLATLNNLRALLLLLLEGERFYLNTNTFYTRFVIKQNVSTVTRFLIVSLQIQHTEIVGFLYDLHAYKLRTLCLPTFQ